MLGTAAMLCAIVSFSQVDAEVERLYRFERLHAEFAAVVDTSAKILDDTNSSTVKQEFDEFSITKRFLPRFVILLEENYNDEAAFKICQWIIDRCEKFGNFEKAMFDADRIAWEVMAARHLHNREISKLCLLAPRYPSRAREQFLRVVGNDYTQPVEAHGLAALALGELLSEKCRLRSEDSVDNGSVCAEWHDYIAAGDTDIVREECRERFREARENYGHILLSPDGEFKTISERAAHGLKQLDRADNLAGN